MTEIVEEAEVVPGTEIVHASQAALWRTEDPAEVVDNAVGVANVLKSVVQQRGLISRINNRDHPRVEAWQTLGSMTGVYAVKEWVREIPWPNDTTGLEELRKRGLVFGYEASFRAQRADGSVLGGGEAACKRTEKTWRDRDDYALESMAQTRATSKALKAPLGFVMALAGYEATPAEEMSAAASAPSDALPHGPDVRGNAELRKNAAQSCVRLARTSDDDAETAKAKGIGLWKLVGHRCGGYVPVAAALALVAAANTENLVPDVEAPDPS